MGVGPNNRVAAVEAEELPQCGRLLLKGLGEAAVIRFVVVVAVIMIAVRLAAAAPPDREVLLPVASCESQGESWCLVLGLAWEGTSATAPIRRELQGKHVIKTFLLMGSLNDGPPKPYAIKFSESLDDYFALTNRSGPIAFISYEPSNRIVLTDRGELRILSKFSLEPTPNIVVIDNPTQTVVARYYSPCLDLSFLKRKASFWDEGRGRCVSIRRGGRTATFAGACAKPKDVVAACAYYRMPSGFTHVRVSAEQIEAAVRDMRPLQLVPYDNGMQLGGGGWGVSAYVVEGTRFLVIRGQCTDCY